MSKLTITAKFTANEGKADLLKRELIKLVEPTRAEEGCINYDLHQDNDNPAVFFFFENWSSRELWQNHMVSPHIKALSEATEGMVAELVVSELTEIA